jgi:hypothetical protein
MTLSRKLPLVLSALTALVALIAAPAASAVGSVSTSKACFVAEGSEGVSVGVSGFRPGKPIFGHFQSGGKVVLTYKFGKASGPCGILHTKSRLFPGHGPRNAKYKVQFDDSKKLSKKASPKIVTGLGSTL